MIYLKVRAHGCFSSSTDCFEVARIRCEGVYATIYQSCSAPDQIQVFNVGQLRRTRARQKAQQYTISLIFRDVRRLNISLRSGIKEDHSANFFSHDNPEGTLSRDRLAEDSLEMLIQWLKDGGNVGIHGMDSPSYSFLSFIFLWMIRCDEQ